jgi:DNA-binding YbaB/EbfC family protein
VKDLSDLMRQAQKMQAEMARADATLEAAEVEGEAGAGLVRATLNGKGVVKRLRIDASLMKPEEAGVLEDLVAAAVNDAKAKADQKAQETMKEVAGGLAGLLPPGFTPPF